MVLKIYPGQDNNEAFIRVLFDDRKPYISLKDTRRLLTITTELIRYTLPCIDPETYPHSYMTLKRWQPRNKNVEEFMTYRQFLILSNHFGGLDESVSESLEFWISFVEGLKLKIHPEKR